LIKRCRPQLQAKGEGHRRASAPNYDTNPSSTISMPIVTTIIPGCSGFGASQLQLQEKAGSTEAASALETT
jgi:hypothetical protein